VLVDDERVAGFGAALAWAWGHGASSLNILVSPVASGVIARRASLFSYPVTVWAVEGRALAPAEASPPVASAGLPPPEMVALLAAHGATPVFEHGALRGEVLGLEVARVVKGSLVVGVGRHDRHARAEMRPGQDVESALDEAVAAVRSRRVAGAAPHPANMLARSRWLRAVVCSSPALVRASSLSPVEPPLPWFDLPDAGAAPCLGQLEGGQPVVAVCSVGVDLDLVPTAADARYMHCPSAALLIVVPAGDDVAVTRGVAGWLASPASVVTVPRSWASEPSAST
jgi:hypothetical protein